MSLPDLDTSTFLDRVLSGREPARTANAVRRSAPFLCNGRPSDITKVYRYMTKGLRGVVLESCLLGGVRVTSDEAVKRFFLAINEADRDGRAARVAPAAPTPRQASSRARRAHEAAAAELRRAGFKIGSSTGGLAMTG